VQNKKAIQILKKVFHHTNTDYGKKYIGGGIGYKTDFLTDSQIQTLKEANLFPNDFRVLTHDKIVGEFLALKENSNINLEFVTALFLKGISGDFPRYRQTLISYYYLKELENHIYTESEESVNCTICNLPTTVTIDRTHALFTYYLGHAWNERPADFIFELQEIANLAKPTVSKEDIELFVTLLKEINRADANETPGQLEKRIAKAKLLPKTDKYKRYGILQTLAVIGILPSKEELVNQPLRSDIACPFAGWKGKLGVNFDKVFEVFNIKIK